MSPETDDSFSFEDSDVINKDGNKKRSLNFSQSYLKDKTAKIVEEKEKDDKILLKDSCNSTKEQDASFLVEVEQDEDIEGRHCHTSISESCSHNRDKTQIDNDEQEQLLRANQQVDTIETPMIEQPNSNKDVSETVITSQPVSSDLSPGFIMRMGGGPKDPESFYCLLTSGCCGFCMQEMSIGEGLDALGELCDNCCLLLERCMTCCYFMPCRSCKRHCSSICSRFYEYTRVCSFLMLHCCCFCCLNDGENYD